MTFSMGPTMGDGPSSGVRGFCLQNDIQDPCWKESAEAVVLSLRWMREECWWPVGLMAPGHPQSRASASLDVTCSVLWHKCARKSCARSLDTTELVDPVTLKASCSRVCEAPMKVPSFTATGIKYGGHRWPQNGHQVFGKDAWS